MLADFPFVLLGAQGHRLGVCGVDTRFTALCPPRPLPTLRPGAMCGQAGTHPGQPQSCAGQDFPPM